MKTCLHCNQPRLSFAPLSDGSPSDCCTGCWDSFKARYDADIADPAWWARLADERKARYVPKKKKGERAEID